ncbi:MAG: hypothetical protein BWY42_01044 [Candidatus Omnitrophica bacterium ADurb.Bin277]|nr:MAG: hypothetical protein BWY42_01044 [Candidatus Omnitrophica bacterium ADurb.Bin277]
MHCQQFLELGQPVLGNNSFKIISGIGADFPELDLFDFENQVLKVHIISVLSGLEECTILRSASPD